MWRNLPEPFKLSLCKIQIVCNSRQSCGDLAEVSSLRPCFRSSHTDLCLNICISCSLEPKYLHKIFIQFFVYMLFPQGDFFFKHPNGNSFYPSQVPWSVLDPFDFDQTMAFLLHMLGEKFSDFPSELGSWCSRGLKSIAFLLFLPFKCHLNSDNVTLKS